MTRGTVPAHDGEPIRFEVFGDAGPYLFLAHGTAEYGNPEVQSQYIEALGERFRLIFIEYPGPVVKQDTLTPDAVARDYLAIADAAGAGDFHYYGYSWGCVTGLQLALRTDRIRSFVCGGFPVLDGPYAEMLRAAQELSRRAVSIDGQPPVHMPAYGRALATYYEGLIDFDDRAAQSRLTMPRLHFVGDADVVTLDGEPLAEYGPKTVRQRQELEAFGWQISILPGLRHLEALRPEVVLPILAPFLETHADAWPSEESKCALDASQHEVRFVTVEPGVELEVLDWGGTGEALVLLAGLGDNAHVFDDFAYQLNDRFRVLGITRRGFGRSSQPAEGYDVRTRARDDIRVLDELGLAQAIFVGHSIAGTEMNEIAVAYPERVKKLVFLDAMDLGWNNWSDLPQPPPPPAHSDADLESVQRFAAAESRRYGHRRPLAAVCHSVRTDSVGRVIGATTPPEIPQKIVEGIRQVDYARVEAPALGIFNAIGPSERLPYYWTLDAASQREFERRIEPLARWIGAAIERFRNGVKGARVIVLEDTSHYLFLVEEALVARETRRFLLER